MESYRETDMAEDFEGEGAAAEFFGVAGELRDLMEAENELLRQGLPLSSLSFAERKRELTEAFAIVSVLDGFCAPIGQNAKLEGTMRLAGTEVHTLSAENANLQSDARSASRRRIDAVLEAALGDGLTVTHSVAAAGGR